jgi:hypothetical protein
MRELLVDEFDIGNVFPVGGGFRINMTRLDLGLIIPLMFKPDGESLRGAISAGGIIEQFGIKQKIMEIGLLPDLMTSKVGDEGWFMIPAFSGCLVDFAERHPTTDRTRIYMDQGEWEKFALMNCFAAKFAGSGILAIVAEGDFNCQVTTELSQKGENRIFPTFEIRRSPREILPQRTKEVVYNFLEGKQSEYPEMAKIYRKYLVEERGVSPLKERIKDNPTLAYSVDAMRVKIFLGCKTPFAVDGSSPMRTYATFAQAEEILDAMKNAGIDKAVVTLVGWNLGGHDGAYPTRFPVEPALGGEAGLRKLIKKAVDMGYQIVPHDNVTDVYRAAPDFDYEYVARTEYGEALPAGLWGGGQSFKVCPTVYLDRYGSEFSRVKELGFTGHYYMDAQSTVMWRCESEQHPADEEQFALSLARLTSLPREMYGAVAIEAPAAYSLPFIDEVSRIHSTAAIVTPIKRCPESFQKIVKRGIPFYQIAVHGLITYQADWVHAYRGHRGGVKSALLAELAFGARPSMEVSYVKDPESNGDYYLDSINDLKEAYEISFEKLRGVHVETIEEFEELGPEAYRLTYSNGVSYAVNFGEKETCGIAPMSVEFTSITGDTPC